MRCRLLLLMCSVFVCHVAQLNFAVQKWLRSPCGPWDIVLHGGTNPLTDRRRRTYF